MSIHSIHQLVFTFSLMGCAAATADDRSVIDQIARLKDRSSAAAYAGWLDYLLHKAEARPTAENTALLVETLAHAERGPAFLTKKRGYFEWAYKSRVDGRGQPFYLGVPNDYDASRSWPLEIYLHGYGGDHVHKAPSSKSHPEPWFQLRPLGRTRGSGYSGLGEVDVFEAIEFVLTHWNIDPNQLHLIGGSMGGFGSLKITSRHPDRFASLRPLAASAIGQPFGNLLNVPVFAIHGGFDEIVPTVMIRAPIEQLRAAGATAALYVDDAHGHGAANSKQAMEDFRTLAMQHRRRVDVPTIRYTAVDGVANGAYWAFVEEWGPEGKPATLNLAATPNNTIFASPGNVAVARIDLERAPVDRAISLSFVFDGQLPLTYPAPLPESLYLVRSPSGPAADAWSVQADAPEKPDFRLHTPSGVRLLYSGEPLMIVYGTGAWEERNEALKQAAEWASLSSMGAWGPSQPLRDGQPVYHMPYGKHALKADRDVTDEDIQKYNLILLGDPRHNVLISRIQKQLPVRIAGTRVVSSDGQHWPFKNAILGLFHYNPLAPQRLIFWVAADQTEDYRESTGSPLETVMDMHSGTTAAPDFLLLAESQTELLAARRFDSRWRWEAGYDGSRLFRESIQVLGPKANVLAASLREAIGTDFGLTRGGDWNSITLSARPGITRLADARAMFYDEVASHWTFTGRELLELNDALIQRNQSTEELAYGQWRDIGTLYPNPFEMTDIDATALYTVASEAHACFSLARYTNADTISFTLTDQTLRDAWVRFAPSLLAGGQ